MALDTSALAAASVVVVVAAVVAVVADAAVEAVVKLAPVVEVVDAPVVDVASAVVELDELPFEEPQPTSVRRPAPAISLRARRRPISVARSWASPRSWP